MFGPLRNIVSATGNIIRKECTVCETIDCENVISVIDGLISDCSSMKQIVLGIPGVIDGAEIEFCDIKELEIADIKRKLQEHFKLIVSMENDMHCMAYGYGKKTAGERGYYSCRISKPYSAGNGNHA